jgi:putative membrane-bound dehydrogenase-like protein
MDPVALEYDEFGRAWVVEMSDYPYTDKNRDRPFTEKSDDLPWGRLRVLEDLNDDGRFDRSTIFAEELSWPTGLAFWRGGVFVAATPDIWYLKDLDGDLRADLRTKVYTGFRKFNVQAVMNNLRWGLDHKIYGAGGTNGGAIVRVADPAVQPIRIGTHDFRFSPVDEQFELIPGGARFGHSFDDWGNRFICNIRNPIRHAVLPGDNLSRNPHYLSPLPIVDVAESGDTISVYRSSRVEPWRALNARRLASDPVSTSPRSESTAAGYMTSACGLTIYRGDAYPAPFYGLAFLGEVAANLVHCQRLIPRGLTFVSERVYPESEFLTSDDNWFRPVNFVNAPDGTLHLLDMYRETIEHPWSIPDDIKESLDLQSGRDRGRIYRLAPAGFQVTPFPKPGRMSTEELVALLRHRRAWCRETAHRLLFERQDPTAVPLLRATLRDRDRDRNRAERAGPAEDNSSDPANGSRALESLAFRLGRLHALWSLAGMNALTIDDVRLALSDPEPRIREHAVRLSERWLADNHEILADVCSLAADLDLRVRANVALVVGGLSNDRAIEALATIGSTGPLDEWMRAAVLSTAPTTASRLLASLVRDRLGNGAPIPAGIVQGLALTIGARAEPTELRSALQSLDAVVPASDDRPGGPTRAAVDAVRREFLLGVGEGLARQRRTVRAMAESEYPRAAVWIAQLIDDARTVVIDDSRATVDRLAALGILAREDHDMAHELLPRLMDSLHPLDLQIAAIQTLARLAQVDGAHTLLAAYRKLTPTARSEAVQQMLARNDWIATLLEAAERNAFPLSDIPPVRRAMLLKNSDAAIRDRAARLFGRELPSPRGEVFQAYQPALAMSGNLQNGQALLRKHCLTCHRLRGEGHDVGPRLETIQHRTPREILLHLVDPNREVSPGYIEFIAVRKDGRIATGIVVSETSASVTLRRAEGIQETIPREEIDELKESGKSIMPEGLEKQLSMQEMADILALLTEPARRP